LNLSPGKAEAMLGWARLRAHAGRSSVNFVVRPWCSPEHYWRVHFDVTQRCKEQLEAAGCSIPFPQRDVHLFRQGEPAA
jgi:small-conductance mechanosensitive channel